MQKRKIAVVRRCLVPSPRVLAAAVVLLHQVEMLAWLERWLVLLQRGSPKLAIVVS